MKRLIIVSLFISVTSLAADTPAANEMSTGTPKQVCEALAKAATENNFKAFMELSAMPMGYGRDCLDKTRTGKNKGKQAPQDHCGMHGKNMEGGFQKMHEKQMDRLKSLSCKDEKIVGDHAWVEATSKEEARLVPFKMMDGKWKFDMRTYHSFYHPTKDSMM